ncbi:MAG: S8 family serine peptidase, partial [Bacteroidetes bacterium]|nr:S8 family serine peptidase [Bacteroidota bacterium]
MNYLATKPIQNSKLRLCISNLFILILLFLFPFTALSQQNQSDIEITVSCVEFVGNGKYIANFGYDNKTKEEIIVPEANSVLTYNNGQSKKNTIRNFKSGKYDNAFSEEFNGSDKITWTLVLPGGARKDQTASINSSHCNNGSFVTTYPAPKNGKENDSKIGAQLTALNKVFNTGKAVSSDDLFQISLDGKKVLITISSSNVDSLISIYGLENDILTKEGSTLVVFFPIIDLLSLNDISSIAYVLPVYTPLTEEIGIKSQGDKAMLSDYTRNAFGLTGENVTVGVISDSYDNKGTLRTSGASWASTDIDNGELPGTKGNNSDRKNPNGYLTDVVVKKDYPYMTGSDEGRAMLQIVHDIAPRAELAFRTGFLGPQDMANGITELQAAGCDIIVDDVTYVTEPFFHDGTVATAVNLAVENGISYFTSAGNYGEKSHEGTFHPATSTPNKISGVAHDFGNGDGDVYQSITLAEGKYTIVLQWDGDWPTETDLDIYLSDGSEILGYNRNNLGGDAVEVLSFAITGGAKSTNIVISKTAGERQNVKFKYIVFRGGIAINEYNTGGTSTIVGHANSVGAMTVGAVRFSETPAYGGDLEIEYYSSVGGMLDRQKPDFCAPDGVNTTVNLGNGDWVNENDPDTDYPNFFGTSAAAPHAAAVAALILEGKSIFYPGVLPILPGTIRAILKSTALEMGVHKNIGGSGFIQADAALKSFANPIPVLDPNPFTVVPVPFENISFDLIIKGNYFVVGKTQVLFRGEPLSIINATDTTLKVFIPAFTGNPAIQVYTPPFDNGEDGG